MWVLGYVPTEINTIMPTNNDEEATIIPYNKKRPFFHCNITIIPYLSAYAMAVMSRLR